MIFVIHVTDMTILVDHYFNDQTVDVNFDAVSFFGGVHLCRTLWFAGSQKQPRVHLEPVRQLADVRLAQFPFAVQDGPPDLALAE